MLLPPLLRLDRHRGLLSIFRIFISVLCSEVNFSTRPLSFPLSLALTSEKKCKQPNERGGLTLTWKIPAKLPPSCRSRPRSSCSINDFCSWLKVQHLLNYMFTRMWPNNTVGNKSPPTLGHQDKRKEGRMEGRKGDSQRKREYLCVCHTVCGGGALI